MDGVDDGGRAGGDERSPVARPADEGFDCFFRATYPRLVVALTLASDGDAAEDAVQDAFVQALRHWDRIHTYDDPAGWVRRVALHRLANRRRWVARRDRAVERLGNESVTLSSLGDTGELVDLRDALGELPRRERLVVVLHHVVDLQVAEVADELDLPEGTVKSILTRTRSRLRSALGERDGTTARTAPATEGSRQ